MPKLKTSATAEPDALVAAHATIRTGANLRHLLLLGIAGTNDAPRALLRLPGGRVETVQIGDTVQGRTVQAIGETRVVLVAGSRAETLEIPG